MLILARSQLWLSGAGAVQPFEECRVLIGCQIVNCLTAWETWRHATSGATRAHEADDALAELLNRSGQSSTSLSPRVEISLV